MSLLMLSLSLLVGIWFRWCYIDRMSLLRQLLVLILRDSLSCLYQLQLYQKYVSIIIPIALVVMATTNRLTLFVWNQLCQQKPIITSYQKYLLQPKTSHNICHWNFSLKYWNPPIALILLIILNMYYLCRKSWMTLKIRGNPLLGLF